MTKVSNEPSFSNLKSYDNQEAFINMNMYGANQLLPDETLKSWLDDPHGFGFKQDQSHNHL